MVKDMRYRIVYLTGFDGLCSIQDTEAEIPTFYNDIGNIDTVKPVCDLLNEQDERIKTLLEDNDHKFWKHQFMSQFNKTNLIIGELGRAINEGYEVSDKFQAYIDELKEENEKNKEKALEQETW